MPSPSSFRDARPDLTPSVILPDSIPTLEDDARRETLESLRDKVDAECVRIDKISRDEYDSGKVFSLEWVVDLITELLEANEKEKP